MTLAKAVGVPVRFALWLGALLIFWPILLPAMLIFMPGTVTLRGLYEVQRDAFKEFVLGEGL
jgi:hypothetical protein